MNTKRVFALLLTLTLLLALLPTRTTKAYTSGQACPDCGTGKLIPIVTNSEQHALSCSNTGCMHSTSSGYIWEDHHGGNACTGRPCCEVCGQEYGPLGHDLVHHDARPATCTEVGWETEGDACSRCSDLNDGLIPALGHRWDTGWTSDGGDTHWHKCLNPGCLERDGEENHTSETVPAVPATCDEGGLSEYTRCSKCEMLLSGQEEYMPLGHLLTPVAKVEATCTTPGTEAYWKCTRDGCGKLFSDAGGKNKITAPVAIEALGHKWDAEWSYDENDHYHKCLNDGCTAKSDDEAAHTGGTATCKAKAKCTVCGAEYGDFAEHVFPVNIWITDDKEHWHVCNVCDQPSAHEAHSGGTPTCTEKGMCEICGRQYVDPLGHEIVSARPVRPTCTEPGMIGFYTCTRCGKPFRDSACTQEGIMMPATGHTEVVDAAVPATCTETGLTEGKHCSACSEVLEEQKTIDALGHQLSPVAKVEPSCTTPGTEAYWQCTRCDKLFSDAEGKNEITAPAAIEALGHLPSPVLKVEPTCTTPGTEAYWKCTRCDKLFSEIEWCFNEITAPVAIEALGHNWGGWTVLFEGENARKTRVCTRCKECELKKIPAPEKSSSPNGDGIDNIAIAITELPFMDVTMDMDIYDDVKYVYEKGIMDGLNDTLFGPDLSLTRGMIVTILYRMEGKPYAEYSGAFSDVPDGQRYTDGVEWAASVGLVLGYGDGTYGTTDNVTREQLAGILYRYAQWKGYAVKTAALKAIDAEDVSDFAVEAMGWAVASGILRPDGDGSIRPGADATRGEIATALHAFLENVAAGHF